MMRDAVKQGVIDAARRFAVREASALETILGVLGAGVGGSVARGALNAVSPRALPALENLGALPVNAIRRVISPTQTPADAIVRHLSKAQLPHIPSGAPRVQ
jgi:asparagine N-glycosylation enzyme membrane subunit Stt3